MTENTFKKNYRIAAIALFLFFIFNFNYGFTAQSVNGDTDRFVYLGGFSVGLVLKPKGVVVVGSAPIETELGSVIASSPLQAGDIIESINGNEIFSANDIRNVLCGITEMTAEVGVTRGTAHIKIKLNLINEDLTGEKRLGLRIRENVAGIGTVTYVKEDGTFGCLGHPILLDNGAPAPCFGGNSFECKIIGYNKGVRGRAGELKGAINANNSTGTIYKNCKSGIYGKFDSFTGENPVCVASRHDVCSGKAEILSSVDGSTQAYAAEIIKTFPQNSVSDKSMIIRITDKRLLGTTGGIVQGMSGSPIIQNNKLVGCVTHVFVSDPTKGYGIYADWMLQNK